MAILPGNERVVSDFCTVLYSVVKIVPFYKPYVLKSNFFTRPPYPL